MRQIVDLNIAGSNPVERAIWMFMIDTVEAFSLFLDEVRITYGNQIKEICRRKLEQCQSIADVDELVILHEAKEEAGFKIENSSLAPNYINFTT